MLLIYWDIRPAFEESRILIRLGYVLAQVWPKVNRDHIIILKKNIIKSIYSFCNIFVYQLWEFLTWLEVFLFFLPWYDSSLLLATISVGKRSFSPPKAMKTIWLPMPHLTSQLWGCRLHFLREENDYNFRKCCFFNIK